MSQSTDLTVEQIIALAPDAQVAGAARKLARPAKWQNLGRDDRACWGEYQGSGRTPYKVAVDLNGPAFKCNCPSRKRPCKHAVGLLLLTQTAPRALQESAPPDWVRRWLVGRSTQKRQGHAETVADPKAQARRAAQRLNRVRQGVQALSLWLEDLLRRGLGSLQNESPSFWETQAARLVDAQAPGLARRVREMAVIPASGDGWQDRLLRQLARLHLLLEAVRRLDDLPLALQEEVRSQVGWTRDQKSLRRQPGKHDCWLVLGRLVTEENRLRVRRTWLWGMGSRQAALILDFASPGRPFESNLIPGTGLDAELVFWPGPLPQRALIKTCRATSPIKSLPGYPDLLSALSAYGTAITSNPWLERFLMPLENVIPVREGDGWAIRDGQDHFLLLDLPPDEGWRLLALGGGHPVTLVAEWNGETLVPLSVWAGDELISVGEES